MIEKIEPKDEAHWLELRTKDVTSTEAAALFGLSPYTTEFELWHRKKEGTTVKFEANERIIWGTRLQDAIAEGVAKDNKWLVRKMTEYMRNPELRMGSSFDFAVEPGGILEVKNVDALVYRDGWVVDGDEVEAPPHIELQVQHQMAVSGRDFAYIAALIGGNTVTLIKREADHELINQIKERVFNFWRSVDSGKTPNPDFKKDADFIRSLYKNAEPGKIIQADEVISGLALTYKTLGEKVKGMTEARDAVKAQLITLIGDAEKCISDDFSISAKVIPETQVSYDRKSYRDFRINFKKGKSNE